MGGGHEPLPTTPATQEEMAAANLAIGYRDACAHLLIPLNKCGARRRRILSTISTRAGVDRAEHARFTGAATRLP